MRVRLGQRRCRLYQSDFMLRDYGFGYDELPFDEHGLLPRDRTPKQAWAEAHLHVPVELNRATRQQLLRIPGVGPKSADKIIEARRETKLRDLSQLRALGVTTGWAAPYVLLDGRACRCSKRCGASIADTESRRLGASRQARRIQSKGSAMTLRGRGAHEKSTRRRLKCDQK